MKTFEELYCERNGCAPRDFGGRIFWKCLHRRALAVAPLILLVNSKYFFHDFDLIARVGRAEKLNQVWEELRDYFVHPSYQGWFRRTGGIRISGRRLIAVAKEYLPKSGATPVPYS